MKYRLLISSHHPSPCTLLSFSAYGMSLGDACSTLLCLYKYMLLNVFWKHVISYQIPLSRSGVQQDTRNAHYLPFSLHRKHWCP